MCERSHNHYKQILSSFDLILPLMCQLTLVLCNRQLWPCSQSSAYPQYGKLPQSSTRITKLKRNVGARATTIDRISYLASCAPTTAGVGRLSDGGITIPWRS